MCSRQSFHARRRARGRAQTIWQLKFRSFAVPNRRALRVAVAVAPDMGATAAVNTLVPLVEQLKPRCLAICGVCAGRRGKVHLGDVVAADRLYYHDTGKQLADHVQQDLTVYKLRDDWKARLERMDPVARGSATSLGSGPGLSLSSGANTGRWSRCVMRCPSRGAQWGRSSRAIPGRTSWSDCVNAGCLPRPAEP